MEIPFNRIRDTIIKSLQNLNEIINSLIQKYKLQQLSNKVDIECLKIFKNFIINNYNMHYSKIHRRKAGIAHGAGSFVKPIYFSIIININ